MKNNRSKDFCLCAWGFIVSGLLLTVIQPPIDWSLLAWVSIVPFILACSPKVKPGRLISSAYLVSACYWLANLYWIRPVTLPGWLTFCLYTALLWPILAVSVRFCRTKNIPLFLAVPLLFVGAERLQGLFLGGFYWRLLAHSQYANITLIQIADIFGAAGVSFLVAMVNGLIAELIIAARQKNIFKIENLVKTVFVCVLITAATVYGSWRIDQSAEFIETGPMAAAVQTNVPQVVKQSLVSEEVTFAELIGSSNESAAAGAELIVWPETMVQVTLDPAILRLLDESHEFKIFDKALKNHAKDKACILVGAYGGEPDVKEDWTIHYANRFNSAFLYQPDGTKAPEQYNKIHLVPFGEVVPFKKSAPWLHGILMKFTPYDYDYSLDYGSEYTIFPMTTKENESERVYKFGVMICYEDSVPKIARKFALDSDGGKRLDWLVNISNDGWFVRFLGGRIIPSSELAQHTSACVFRAVENRLAVLRSVNTGISCLIDTLGNIKNGYQAGNLPIKAMARKGVAGWFADVIPIDERVTFFSRYGQWLDLTCAAVLFLIFTAALRQIRSSKKHRKEKNG